MTVCGQPGVAEGLTSPADAAPLDTLGGAAAGTELPFDDTPVAALAVTGTGLPAVPLAVALIAAGWALRRRQRS